MASYKTRITSIQTKITRRHKHITQTTQHNKEHKVRFSTVITHVFNTAQQIRSTNLHYKRDKIRT